MAALLCALLLILGAGTARAALIESDFLTVGDGLLLFDDATGLEWLDLTETVGLSYDDLQNGLGAEDYIGVHGFRFATTPELGVLWTNAGIVDFSGSSVPGNQAGVAFLLSTMGCTLGCGGANEVAQGQVEFDPAQAQLNNPFMLGGAANAAANLLPGFTSGRSQSSASLGNYLVRTAVTPEPSTGALLALGLVVLCWRRRSG